MEDAAATDYGAIGRLLTHAILQRGKRMRPALVLLSGKFYNYQPEKLLTAAAAVELLHTATLIHDDVVDESFSRRGIPTLNALTSGRVSILVGDYIFAKSATMALASRSLRVMEVFSDTLVSISEGELREIMETGMAHVSKEAYYRRIECKTASLFRAATEVGAIISDAPEPALQALRSYGYNLGMAFQIVDDVLDFIGDEREMGKPVGSDLLQGTITLPAIYLVSLYPTDNPVAAMFQGGADTEALARRAVEMVAGSEAIELSYGDARDFIAHAKRDLEALPDNESRQALHALADYALARRR